MRKEGESGNEAMVLLLFPLCRKYADGMRGPL